MSLIETKYSDTAPVPAPLLRGQTVPPAALANPRFSSQWTKTDDLDADFIAEWTDLADDASEPNPFYEPHLLLPALKHLTARDNVQILTVRDRLMANRLVMLVPLQITSTYRGLPAKCARPWRHIHTFLATPLVRHGDEKDGLRGLMTQLATDGIPLLRLHHMASDGPINAALRDIAEGSDLAITTTRSFERAILKSDLDADDYLASSISKKKRKEYGRLTRRLADEGDVSFEAPDMSDPACVEGVVLEFLELERMGWKGHAGTAIASRPSEARFFFDACRAAAASGNLSPLTLRLNNTPIASIINFNGSAARDTSLFSFKIAYDETYARFSPGVLLELELTTRALGAPDITCVDSCANPDHPMIDHLWRERRAMQDVTVATSNSTSATLVGLAAASEKSAALAKRQLQAAARAFKKSLLKRKAA
ncbi:MAG: GNAT family N-acetyltransferase [Pseudomonadota bacterium]